MPSSRISWPVWRKLARLAQEKADCETLLEELTQKQKLTKQQDISRTDRDSRRMKRGHGAGTQVGYNVQVAVDGQHGLIVAEEVVTQANDLNQLSTMTRAALSTLEEVGTEVGTDAEVNAGSERGAERTILRVVADSGYSEADELAACEGLGVEAFVPRRRTTQGQGRKGSDGQVTPIFAKDRFTYDVECDTYLCPAEQRLARVRERVRDGKLNYYYRTNACTDCPLKAQCTTTKYRCLTRRAHEGAVERARERVKSDPAMMGLRQSLVERVFGTMRLGGHDQFLMRGLTQVRGEFSLSALSYNWRRVVNIVGVPDLLKALRANSLGGVPMENSLRAAS